MELVIQVIEPTDGTIPAGTVVFYPGIDGILRSKNESDVVVTYAESNGITTIVNDILSNMDFVTSVNTLTGDVTLNATSIGLGNVPNIDTRQRSNHQGTQSSNTISDFAQAVRNTVLTGFSAVVNAANIASVIASDSVLEAIQKLQARTALLFYAEFARNTTGLINDTTTEADFVLLNANVPVAGNYKIDWSWSWSGNDGAQDCIVGLEVNGNSQWQQVQEPKDTAGTGANLPNTTGGTSNSGTNQRHLHSSFDILNLSAGANEIKMTLDSSGVGDLNAIYKGVIAIKKFGLS